VGLQAMADRYTYLPQIGLVVAVTWGFARLVSSWRDRRGVAVAVSALVVLVLMGLSWRQVSYWQNSETLWTHATDSTPGNYIAEFNLGVALAENGRMDEAVTHYQKALEIKPNYAAAHNNIGIIQAGRGRFDEAMAHYRKALEVKPDSSEVHHNLGLSLSRRGEMEEAIVHFRKALEINPDYTEAHINLGVALAGKGEAVEAITHYRRALEIKPNDANALNNLAWIESTCPTDSIRNGAEAVELAQRAILLTGGNNPAMLDTLAAAFAEAKRFPEAVRTLERAVSLASAQKDKATADILRSRMKLYKAGKPLREKPAGR
jgi:tetratricopeptide (TPR) repeat protein